MAAKTLVLDAKVSDLCSIQVLDENGETVRTHDGYVPDWFPEGGGDYIILEIDVETGTILNWKRPTEQDINSLNGK